MSVLYTTTAAEFGDFDISPSATNIVNMVLTDSPPLRAQRVPSPGLMAEPITIRHTQQQQQQGHTLSPVASRLPPAAADDDVFDLPPPPDMQAGDEPLTDLERSNLYVSNVSTDVDDDEFRVLFSAFGVILNSRIMVDIHTCKSRGFGFVQFSNPSEAAKAVRAMDGTVHRSQTLMVRLASRKTRQPGQLTAKMFVRNVPAGISEDEVRRYCSRFGAVQNCAVRPDMQHGVVTDTNTGGVSQVAYITFVEVDATKKAALSLNNTKPWPSCVHPLLAKVLDSNQKRRTKEEEAIHTSGGSAFGQPGSANSSATNPRTGPTLMESPGFDDSRNSTHGAAPSMPLLSPSAVPPPVMLAGSAIPSHNTPTYLQQQPAYAPPPTFLAPQHTMLPPAPAQQMAAPTGYQIVMQPTLQPIYGTSSPHNAYMSQASMQPPQLYQSPPGMLPSPHSLGMGTPTAMVGTPQGLISTPQGLMSTHTQQPQPHWAQPQQVYVMSPPPNGAAGANMVLAPRTVVRHNPFSTM